MYYTYIYYTTVHKQKDHVCILGIMEVLTKTYDSNGRDIFDRKKGVE